MPNTQYQPLPLWQAVPDTTVIATTRRTPSATTLADASTSPKERTLTGSAKDGYIPVAYGQVPVPGKFLTLPVVNGAGNLVFAMQWCLGEIASVDAVYLNDAALDPSITVTHYEGKTTQLVDSTLQAAIPGYNDDNVITVAGVQYGIAYSVFEIPTGVLVNGALNIRAIVSGRKVYDPRDMTTAYSDNPSLCMADAARLGLGSSTTTVGDDDCADWNDELLGGAVARARLSLLISKGASVDSHLNILSTYAECFYSYDGDGISMVPDRIVDLSTVETVDASHVLGGQVNIGRKSSINAPSEVSVRYIEPSGGAAPWESITETTALPGVDDGSVIRIPTTLSMEGVYRDIEARNKATAKLNRLNDQVEVSWLHTDSGIVKQKGDVVRLHLPKRNINNLYVRILDINMQDYGRYQIRAEKYSDEFYPSEIDTGDDGLVPIGVIGLLSGSTIPTGWADYSDADGKHIICAGDTYAVGDTGGSATFAGFSGSTTSGGGHLGSTAFDVVLYSPSGAETGRQVNNNFEGAHTHTYNTGVIDPEPYTRNNRLVIKTGSADTSIPKDVISLGLDGIIDGDAARVTTFTGRLLASAASSSDSGVITKNLPFGVSSETMTHDHGNNTFQTGLQSTVDFPNTVYNFLSSTYLHSHSVSADLIRNLERYNIGIYSGINDYAVKPGRAFLWSGSLGSLPTDWYLCDGNNNTPDMTDCFIELAGATATGRTGDNSISLNAETSSYGHAHQGTSSVENMATTPAFHSDSDFHSHFIDDSDTWLPEYYALAVIMYLPSN